MTHGRVSGSARRCVSGRTRADLVHTKRAVVRASKIEVMTSMIPLRDVDIAAGHVSLDPEADNSHHKIVTKHLLDRVCGVGIEPTWSCLRRV